MSIPYSSKLFGILPWYGLLIVIGICAAMIVISKDCKEHHLPKDTAVDVALVAIPCGVIGARLYYVMFSWEQYKSNLLHILYIWEGGVAIYGAVIGGAIGIFIYTKRKKLSFLEMADIILPAVLLAQSIGRWGNYFNMEAYGRKVLNPLFQFFPFSVQIAEDGHMVWHMATFFYESLWNFVGFCFLRAIRRQYPERRKISCWYLLVYGSGRFIIEQLREDSLYFTGLRASQWLSFILCVFAILFLFINQRKTFAFFQIVCACSWMIRWFFSERLWIFLLIQLISSVLLIACCLHNRRLCLRAILIDLLSLIFYLMKWNKIPFSSGFSSCLFSAFLSVSLIVCIFLLTKSLKEVNE